MIQVPPGLSLETASASNGDYPKTPKKQREVKGFYTDKQGRTRPITSRGVSKKSLKKAEENKEALASPKR